MFLTTPLPFGAHWARAAARVAHVTTVSRVRGRLSWPSLPGVPWMAMDPDDPARIEVACHPSVRLRPSRVFRPLFFRFDEGRVAKVLDVIARHRRVDLLHTHYFAMWQLQRLARRRRIPLVHTEHSSGLTDQPVQKKAVSRVGRRLAAQLFREATVVTTVSRFLERSIRDAGFQGRFEVVPNPIDTTRFAVSPFPDARREIVVGTVGRLAPEKSVDVLLRAFAILHRGDPRVRLRIAGRGPTEGALRRVAHDLGIDRVVSFEGFVPPQQMPAFLSGLHVFASTTRVETFGVAVAEAIAAGRPVVATNSGALEELVLPTAGRLVSKGPNEAQRFAEALETTIRQLPRTDPASIGAVAVTRFSDDAVAERLRSVYDRAMG